MDPDLLASVCEATPDINDRVARGLATEHMREAEAHVNKIFECAARDFPEGLVYEGYAPCSPDEEFREVTRVRDNRQVYELADNDFYLVSYHFSYNGERLYPQYLQLPFVDDGGVMKINGNRFAIHPVLADPAFSMGMNNMFIQLTRTRLVFERTIHHFVANGEREPVYVVWSWVHNTARANHGRSGSNKKVYSTLAHYLFIQYGVTGALREFAGADIVIGTDADITKEKYPAKDWVICSTTGLAPPIWQKHEYRHTRVCIAVPRRQWSDTARNLVGTLFYLLDHFPHRLEPQYLDTPWIWKVTLGHIVYKGSLSEGVIVNDIDEHLVSLDEYIDFMVREDLRRAKIMADNIYELFVYVIETLSQQTVASEVGVSSIYGKRMTVLRYVLYDLVVAINGMLYQLRKLQKKKGDMTIEQVNRCINKALRGANAKKIGDPSKHPEVSSVSCSNDNMFFGITCTVVPQEDASQRGRGGGGSKKINLKEPSKHLHASIAEVASYSNQPKSDPTGRSRINPCVLLDETDTVSRRRTLQALLDGVQKLLTR